MKLKSKLILAASSLLVLSGVAAGTGTYAWYTANRTVGLDVSTVGVTAQTSTLSVEFVAASSSTNIASAAEEDKDAGDSLTLTTTDVLTDVSGKGDAEANFVKPILGSANSSANTNIAGWYTPTTYAVNHTYAWYQKVTLTFSVTGLAASLFLSPSSSVIDNTTNATPSVKDAVRYSIISGKNQMVYANPNGTEVTYTTQATTTHTYEADTAVKDAKVDNTVTSPVPVTTANFFTTGALNHTEADFSASKLHTAATGYVGEINATTPLTITMLIWVEGQDTSITATATDFAAAFDMNLSFYTLLPSRMVEA